MLIDKTKLAQGNAAHTLPEFSKYGFYAVKDTQHTYINLPGINTIDALPEPSQYTKSHELARYLLMPFHPEAAENNDIVAKFDSELVSEVLKEGGQIPHETIKDWLFYNNVRNAFVASD